MNLDDIMKESGPDVTTRCRSAPTCTLRHMAGPTRVVKEHRRAAWVIWLVLIVGFLSYCGITVKIRLEQRKTPAVSIDLEEGAWALPDITACIAVGDGGLLLVELKKYTCDMSEFVTPRGKTTECVATTYANESMICVVFETSGYVPRYPQAATNIEFTWTEVHPDALSDDYWQTREATLFMGGIDEKDSDSFVYYVPLSSTAINPGWWVNMNPERKVRHRLGHPYGKPLTEDVKYTATFTTSPMENYGGFMSQTNLTCAPEFQVARP
jgi:hypothetical protein